MNRLPSPLTAAADAVRGMFDVCIIGSGPVGVAFAGELNRDGLRIVLLEAGKEHLGSSDAAWRQVPGSGLAIKPGSRERALGGSSTTWGGLSALLDPVDFTRRSWVPHSGWPLTLEELMPFYTEAARLYGFPGTPVPNPPLPSWKGLTHKLFQAPDRPANFATNFLLRRAQGDFTLLTDASVAELQGDALSHRVTHASVLDGQGRRHQIQARHFILAVGTIENVRLLLASRFTGPQGLGNDHDQVGRFFMNHPKGWHGCIRPDRKLDWTRYTGFRSASGPAYYGLHLTEARQRELGVLNPCLRVDPAYDSLPMPLRRIAGLMHRLTGRQLLRAPFLRVRNFMEMQPSAENRIRLSDQLDPHGAAIPRVDYHLTDLDRRSLAALHETLDQELQETQAGRLEDKLSATTHPWPVVEDASHHLGGTRMGDSPATSVTDRWGRLHGHPEVTVGGGGLFPTAGHVNPTWTMVALAIRSARALRDHFRSS